MWENARKRDQGEWHEKDDFSRKYDSNVKMETSSSFTKQKQFRLDGTPLYYFPLAL